MSLAGWILESDLRIPIWRIFRMATDITESQELKSG